MKSITRSTALLSLVAGMACLPLVAQDEDLDNPYDSLAAAQATSARGKGGNAKFAAAEKDLSAPAMVRSPKSAGREEAVIETSRPYLLPRLFTIPTAYSLQSYEVRFGGQGNIHSTLANMNTEGLRGSASIGLGGIMELGYQLDEYYTVEDISDKSLMGYFKLSLLKETPYLPAVSLSASKNLRDGFHTLDTYHYQMDRDGYELAVSKAFRAGNYMIGVHPGVQIVRDEVTAVRNKPDSLGSNYKATQFNPRLGITWQSRPKTLFMYEVKLLHPVEAARLERDGITTDPAIENNLGIRYYLRNWLCIDAGVRHFYNIEKHDDEMKLHANFVGVVPLVTLYERIENYFKK